MLPAVDPDAGLAVSWLGLALNIVMFTSQTMNVYRCVMDPDEASRARYARFPALSQAAACSMWVLYAICVLPTPALIANNAWGVILSLLYALGFAASRRPSWRGAARELLAWLACVAIAALVYGGLYGAPATGVGSAHPQRDDIASGLTTAVTIAMWGAPLIALREAAMELDTSRVPVPLTLCQVAATSTWLAVGVYVGDITLIICSVFGVVLSSIQLLTLGWIVWRRKGKAAREGAGAGAKGGVAGV